MGKRCYVLLLAICISSILAFPYTCDELTPDLCGLKVTPNNMTVKSLRLNYWIYEASGDTSGSTQRHTKLPLIIAHGGPGWSHHYMLPLKQQACRGRQVLFYDQVGSGHSQHVNDVRKNAPWLLDADYKADELEALIKHVGWEKYHYLGNSWGTMLGQIFACRQPHGLTSMILSGPLSDAQLYIKAQWDRKEGNLASLPPFIQDRIHKLDAAKAYESKEYASLDAVLTSYFTVRITPPPDCFDESIRTQSKEIYIGMQGASEFTIAGALGSFNYTGRLHEIKVPVLLTSGRYDTMRPPCVKVMYDNLPRVEWHMFPHSGHVSMIDDAGEMNHVVASFLDRSESGACCHCH